MPITRRPVAFALPLLLAIAGAGAETTQEPPDRIIAEARSDCASLDGEFSLLGEAVVEIDLTGDNKPETLLDASRFSCSTSASLFCGTGGCSISVLVDGQTYQWLSRGWKVVEWEPHIVLLLDRHGSDCGGNNMRSCVEALTWTEGGFSTVRKQQ